MNWDQLEGKWKQYKGEVREKWGKLTDDDLHIIAGRREQLIGRLQERYGIAKEVAAREADEFVKALTAQEEIEQRTNKAKAAKQGLIRIFCLWREAGVARQARSPGLRACSAIKRNAKGT